MTEELIRESNSSAGVAGEGAYALDVTSRTIVGGVATRRISEIAGEASTKGQLVLAGDTAGAEGISTFAVEASVEGVSTLVGGAINGIVIVGGTTRRLVVAGEIVECTIVVDEKMELPSDREQADAK